MSEENKNSELESIQKEFSKKFRLAKAHDYYPKGTWEFFEQKLKEERRKGIVEGHELFDLTDSCEGIYNKAIDDCNEKIDGIFMRESGSASTYMKSLLNKIVSELNKLKM